MATLSLDPGKRGKAADLIAIETHWVLTRQNLQDKGKDDPLLFEAPSTDPEAWRMAVGMTEMTQMTKD